MKIVLAALNAKYIHSNLAVYDIEAYAKKKMEKENQFFEKKPDLIIREYTINHNLDRILQSLYQEKAAVVAFSCYIWNMQEILTIAKELKKVAPRVKIWLGGPEVSYDSESLLEKYSFIEGVMLGEGEATFYELLKCWSGVESVFYEEILGIAYRTEDGVLRKNTIRPLLSLDEVPFVYDDLERFQNKILYYETSRGCPFSCSYCLSSIDKSVRFRSMEIVKKELQFFLDHNVPQVKFIDRTFNCNREHALNIWRYLLENDNGVTNFHFEVAADLIDEEELSVFRCMRPGLIQLEIGLQSTNEKTIREIRRVMNVEKVKYVLKQIRSYGNIHQHLDLIAGLPYEDFNTFVESFNQAYEMEPNQLQLGFLKVLKGSYMGEQVSAYGLQYQDVQPYEVLSTNWIQYDEILTLKMVEEMVEVYYNSAQFEHTLAYMISAFDSPFVFFLEIGKYYKEHDFCDVGFKREARYEILRRFWYEWLGKSDKNEDKNVSGAEMVILDSLLTYDFYLRENAKSRPSWSKKEPIEKKQYQMFFRNGGNEDICLQSEQYDSKVAARMMHLEPIVTDALKWIAPTLDMDSKAGATIDNNEKANKFVYCLFDYENRNPLSKEANVSYTFKL